MQARFGLLILAALALPLAAQAQFGDILRGGNKNLPNIRIPSLSELTKEEPPLTSTIDTVKFFGFPEFDDLQPTDFVQVTQDQRNKDFNYDLPPGHYQFDFKSFCVRGYTYGPTEGMGFLNNKWSGSKVDFLKEILHRYNAKPEVDQKDIQLLVWAVIARVKPQDMKGGARDALLALFGKDGEKMMAKGALDFLSEKVTKDLFAKVDSKTRPFYEYDNKMRGMFYRANVPYSEFEKLAVLPAPPDAPKTQIPANRWQLDPAGYLFRVTSTGYSKIRMQVVVPRSLQITRDTLHRITKLSAPDYEMTLTYDDVTPFVCPDDSNMKGYVVSKVTITNSAGTITSPHADWVFQGAPSPKRKLFQSNPVWLRLMTPLRFQNFFERWQGRYERAKDMRDRFESYDDYYQRTQRIRNGSEPENDLFDVSNIRDMIKSLWGGEEDRLEQIADTHGRMAEHLAHADSVIDSLPTTSTVDPTDHVNTPAAPGHQNLVSSSNTW